MMTLMLATLVALTNQFGSVQADSVGALVLSYVPAGGKDVFFRQTGARNPNGWYNGGVPICWPWFGQQGDPGTSSHGFVRTKEWTLVSCANAPERSRALFRLEAKDEYRLEYEIVLDRTLSLKLDMTNLGAERFPVTTGLHPYFAMSAVENVTVVTPKKPIKCFAGMDGGRKFGEGTYEIVDKGSGRRLSLKTLGNNNLILWNLGTEETLAGMVGDDWRRYVCVEPAVYPRSAGFYLDPGETRSLGLVCTVLDPGK